MTVQIINLDDTEDLDIIEWLNGLDKGNKSKEVRAAIRSYMGKPKPSLADVIQAIEILKARIEQGSLVLDSGPMAGPIDEPEQAARNLDNLLNILNSGEFDGL